MLVNPTNWTYPKSAPEKDFFSLETFKERGSFVETLENLYFKSWYINNFSQKIR